MSEDVKTYKIIGNWIISQGRKIRRHLHEYYVEIGTREWVSIMNTRQRHTKCNTNEKNMMWMNSM